jgi:hypothetical protein
LVSWRIAGPVLQALNNRVAVTAKARIHSWSGTKRMEISKNPLSDISDA